MLDGSIVVDGINRTFKVFRPSLIKKKYPVVLNLHGGGGNAGAAAYQTQLNETGRKEKFIVVYPEGTGPYKLLTWNAGICCGSAAKSKVNDVKFISSLIDELIKTGYADPNRIYATGMSNGAMMCYRLACELSDKIAAICAVSASMGVDGPIPKRPVPIMEIHGASDQNAPMEGGIGSNAIDKVSHKPVMEVIETWRKWNNCNKPNIEVTDKYTKLEWNRIEKNTIQAAIFIPSAPVILYALANSGHVWPNGLDITKDLGTGPMSDFPTNKVMWEFFRKFTL